MYLNKVFLYGNLTRDPEIRALPSGASVASFGLATNRTYKDKEGQKQDATEFHNIVVFGRLAEVIGQYAKKGRPLFIEGRMQTRSWEGEKGKQYRTEIVLENFQFGPSSVGPGQGGDNSPRSEEGGTGKTSGKPASDEAIAYPEEDINPDDIPF